MMKIMKNSEKDNKWKDITQEWHKRKDLLQ
jgi:hypothetical protein